MSILGRALPHPPVPRYGGTTTSAVTSVIAVLTILVPIPANGSVANSTTWTVPPGSPLRVDISVSATSGIVNENLTANATGGTPPYSYVWNGGWTGRGPIAAELTAPGDFVYTVVVTDATGDTAAAFYHLAVAPPGRVGYSFLLSAAIQSLTPTPRGATVSFVSSVSGNSAPIQYMHWDFGDGGGSAAANPTHMFNGTGEFRVVVSGTTNANYSGGGSSAFYGLDVIVNSSGRLAIASGLYLSGPVSNGSSFGVAYALNGAAVGGVPPYEYRWTFGDGSHSPALTNASIDHTFWTSGPASFAVTLNVTDSGGATWTTSLSVALGTPSSGGGGGGPVNPSKGGSGSPEPLIVASVLAASSAVSVFLLVRRRRRDEVEGPAGVSSSDHGGISRSGGSTRAEGRTADSSQRRTGPAVGPPPTSPNREDDLLADVL